MLLKGNNKSYCYLNWSEINDSFPALSRRVSNGQVVTSDLTVTSGWTRRELHSDEHPDIMWEPTLQKAKAENKGKDSLSVAKKLVSSCPGSPGLSLGSGIITKSHTWTWTSCEPHSYSSTSVTRHVTELSHISSLLAEGGGIRFTFLSEQNHWCGWLRWKRGGKTSAQEWGVAWVALQPRPLGLPCTLPWEPDVEGWWCTGAGAG